MFSNEFEIEESKTKKTNEWNFYYNFDLISNKIINVVIKSNLVQIKKDINILFI